MRTQSIKHLGLLVCGAFLLYPGSSLEAEERRFRLRIPNPIPRIMDRIEKVGDFVGRTARRTGRDEDDERRRRSAPPLPEPMSPPTEEIIVVHPGDPRYPKQDPISARQTQNRGPVIVRSPVTPKVRAPSGVVPVTAADGRQTLSPRIVVVAPVTDNVTIESANETATPTDLTTVISPMAIARSIADDSSTEGSDASPNASPPEPVSPSFGRPVLGRPGLVYPPGAKTTPENRVDVKGIPPGTKVRDPSTGQIFLVP